MAFTMSEGPVFHLHKPILDLQYGSVSQWDRQGMWCHYTEFLTLLRKMYETRPSSEIGFDFPVLHASAGTTC